MKQSPVLQGSVKTSILSFISPYSFFIHSILFNIFILTILGSVYLFPFLISLILIRQMNLKLPKMSLIFPFEIMQEFIQRLFFCIVILLV